MDILPHEKQIYDYEATIAKFKEQNKGTSLFDQEIRKLEKKLVQLKESVYSRLTPWERVTICRHPDRPNTIDYVKHICDDFKELHGDRLYRNDTAVVGGLAYIGGQKCMVIGQERGFDTESRIYRNFGMLHPEGFRKALRLMKLAEKFSLPVVSFVDTPGAFAGLEAEKRGQGSAIATNLFEMSRLKTPILVLIIGEGYSGGALGMGLGDVVGMLQHAVYSVISPESCASILWKNPGNKKEAASALRLNSEDMLEFGIIDHIIPEPLGGAHHDPGVVYNNVKSYIIDQLESLKGSPSEKLLQMRYSKYRVLGRFVQEETLSTATS